MRIDERIRSDYDLTPSQYADVLSEARGWLEDIGCRIPPDALSVLVVVDQNYVGGISQFVVDTSPLWEEHEHNWLQVGKHGKYTYLACGCGNRAIRTEGE